MAKTELFARWTNGSMVVEDQGNTTGKRFFVDSTTGTDAAGYGYVPEKPVATLDYAMALCTANQGDVIYVMPGHAETLTVLVTCDVAGVKIVGLGEGFDQPEFTVNANIDGISITADNVTLENLRFNEGTAAHTSNINVAAANVTLRRIYMDAGTNEIDAITATAAAEKLTVEDCVWLVTANGPDDFILFEGVVDLPVIRRCYLVGCDGTNACDDGILNFGGQAITNAIVVNNVFDGADQATTVMADVASLVGDCVANNAYAGSATDADTVSMSTVTIANDGITAAKIANAAIDAATFAVDALAAIEAEAEDALEGESLDHIAAVTTAGADMTTEVVDGSILSRILTAAANTSDYTAATDSLEAQADQGLKLDGATLAVDPAAGSLASFIASGGTALGSPLGDSASLVDALGTNGVAVTDTAVSVLGAIGANNADNAFDSSTVVANADGSVLERQQYVQAEADKLDMVTLAVAPAAGSLASFVASGGTALGTPLGDSASLVDALGSDGVTVTDSAVSVLGAIGANNANNAFASNTVAANVDGSVLERQEFLQLLAEAVSYNSPRYLSVTADFTSATWNAFAGLGPTHEVFNVTGLVRMKIWAECTGDCDSAGHAATLQLGVEGATNALIAATDETELDNGDLWYDATPTVGYEAYATAVFDYISNGLDVGYEIGVEDVTSGSLVFHCVWQPLNATGAVVAGAGGAL